MAFTRIIRSLLLGFINGLRLEIKHGVSLHSLESLKEADHEAL